MYMILVGYAVASVVSFLIGAVAVTVSLALYLSKD